MKVKCPSCETVGRLPADKIPDTGANIRCPACSFVFFVGGPDGANVVDLTMESGLLPAAHHTGSQASVTDEMLRAQREKMARQQAAARAGAGADAEATEADTSDGPTDTDDDTTDAGADRAAGADDATGASPAEPAAPAPPPPVTSAPDPTTRRERSGAYLSTASTSDSFKAATVPPPVAEPAQPETVETPSGTFVVGPANAKWKARSNVGIVYDFPDRTSVRGWLGRRETHDGITVSFDGGEVWYTPDEVAGLRDVAPGSAAGSTTGRVRRPARVDQAIREARAAETNEAAARKRKTIPPATTALSAITAPSDSPPEALEDQSSIPAPAVAAGSRTLPPRKRQQTGSTRTAADEARAAVEAKRARADERAAKKAEKQQQKAAKKSGGEGGNTTRYGLLFVLFVVALGAGAWYVASNNTNTGFPNSPVGEQAAWALGMVNAELEEITAEAVGPRLHPTIVSEVGVDVFVEQLRYFASTRSSYELIDFLDRPTATRLDAEIRTNAMERGVMTVVVSEDAPHLIIGLQFQGDYAFAPTFR